MENQKPNLRKKIKKTLKKILIGRDLQFFDKFVFWFSGKKSSGWVIGNKLRNLAYGKNKGISKEPLIFIGCFPRSGSTLLTAMLKKHPEIVGPKAGRREHGGEMHIFQDIKTPWFLKEGFGLNEGEIKNLEKYKNNNIKFTDKLIKLYRKKHKGKYVLLKQPKHIYFIKKIFKHFPNAKFIHLIRDGRDATMSQRYFLLPEGRKEWPYEWCCRQWAVSINKGKEFRKDLRYREVKYEDIINKPEETINQLFEFLDLKKISKKKLLGFYSDKGSSDPKDISQPLNKRGIHKWIGKMSKEDKEKFKRIAGEELKDVGHKF